MGIAEQNAMGTAIGFAISNKIPIISGFSIFCTGRAWEFIRMICHDNLNVKIIATHGGFVGEDGSTHHALEDLSLMSILPNLNVLVPADAIELKQMLTHVLNSTQPFFIRLPRSTFPVIHNDSYNFQLGKFDKLKDGKDIALIGVGYGSIFASKIAKRLEKELDLSIKVLNLSTIKPIDTSFLSSELRSMKGTVVIEEHNTYCGIGSIVAKIISELNPIPMKFLGINNSFGESGPRDVLLDKYGFNFANLKKLIEELLN
jgi:transketolase